jgi:hypothetical protein
MHAVTMTALLKLSTALMGLSSNVFGSVQGAREVQQLLQMFVGELQLHTLLASLLAWLQQQPELLTQQQQQQVEVATVVPSCADVPVTLTPLWQQCVSTWTNCVTCAQMVVMYLPGADISTDSTVLAFKGALVAAGRVAAAAAEAAAH